MAGWQWGGRVQAHAWLVVDVAVVAWGVVGISQGNIPGNTRLGIPAINMNDGPQGFRGTIACAVVPRSHGRVYLLLA